MNRLHSDPSLLICPDFMVDVYHLSCLSLVMPITTEAQVTELLSGIWTTTNDTLHTQWQFQVAEDDYLHLEQQHLAEEESKCLRLDKEVTKNDKKKNHSKH